VFERVYPEHYQERYGFWRPVIRNAVDEYLKCGEMQIVSFIEAPDQSHVIERILRHCNMWNPPCRASPEPAPPEQLELEYGPFDDFAEAL